MIALGATFDPHKIPLTDDSLLRSSVRMSPIKLCIVDCEALYYRSFRCAFV